MRGKSAIMKGSKNVSILDVYSEADLECELFNQLSKLRALISVRRTLDHSEDASIRGTEPYYSDVTLEQYEKVERLIEQLFAQIAKNRPSS